MRKPFRGDMVDYYHNNEDKEAANNGATACPAIITAVFSTETANLVLFPDNSSKTPARTSVERGILSDDLLEKTKNPFWLYADESKRYEAALTAKNTRRK